VGSWWLNYHAYLHELIFFWKGEKREINQEELFWQVGNSTNPSPTFLLYYYGQYFKALPFNQLVRNFSLNKNVIHCLSVIVYNS
jgi:hypothetical protein